MNEIVGLLLMIILWLSISFLLFRSLKGKHKKKPINFRKYLDFFKHWGGDPWN